MPPRLQTCARSKSSSPEDREVQFSIGLVLEQLGGYGEAKAVYDDLLERWPDEELRVALRLGALHRQQERFEAALEPVDALASRGPKDGMRYHYHRGSRLHAEPARAP